MPWWAWVPVLLMAGLLAAELHMGHPGVLAWLPYLVTVPLAVAVLLWLGRLRVVVGSGPSGPATRPGPATESEPASPEEVEIRAGQAHMPVRFVGRTDIVRGAEKQQAMGPDLDPQAFVVHRPWVGPAVRLEVVDPDDPTPYWVVSTRHPERLVAVLDAQKVSTDRP